MATTCTIKLGSLVPSKLGSLVPSTTASHSSPNTPTVSKALLARFFPEHGGVRRRAAQAHAALYRYSLIRPLADPGLSPVECSRLVRELAAQVHLGPSGQPVTRSAGFKPTNPTSCASATGCTARSSRASGRCCSRCSTTVPATWSGIGGATARTPGPAGRVARRGQNHGCPRRLYADNGSAYASKQLAWSAAVLDIALVHSKPGKPLLTG